MDRAFIDQAHQIGDGDEKATVNLEHIKNDSAGIGGLGQGGRALVAKICDLADWLGDKMATATGLHHCKVQPWTALSRLLHRPVPLNPSAKKEGRI
jgi:hypothetical protein